MQSFPAYRFDGDKDAAAALRLVAQNLLHQAREIDKVSASRITKLVRQTLQGTIEVLIIEGQEYVNIFGNSRQRGAGKKKAKVTFRALSGLIRVGELVEVAGVKKIRDYRPTVDAFNTSLDGAEGKEPDGFHDEELLVDAPNGLGCAFSGLMSQLVQLVSGFAPLELEGDTDGLKITPNDGVFSLENYSTGYLSTHGIVKLGETFWIVEISRDNGMLARKLELLEVEPIDANEYEEFAFDVVKSDATDECERLFGGIPAIGRWPAGAVLAQQIEDGIVKRVMTTEQLEPVFRPSTYGFTSWSFNTSGSEAHNVVFRGATAIHYRLTFSGGEDQITAMLSEVSSGLVVSQGASPVIFFDGSSPQHLSNSGQDIDTTVFVCHHGDNLVTWQLEYKIRPQGADYRTYVRGANAGKMLPSDQLVTVIAGTLSPEDFPFSLNAGEVYSYVGPEIGGPAFFTRAQIEAIPVDQRIGNVGLPFNGINLTLLPSGSSRTFDVSEENVSFDGADGDVAVTVVDEQRRYIYIGASNRAGRFLQVNTVQGRLFTGSRCGRSCFIAESSSQSVFDAYAFDPQTQQTGIFVSVDPITYTVVGPGFTFANTYPHGRRRMPVGIIGDELLVPAIKHSTAGPTPHVDYSPVPFFLERPDQAAAFGHRYVGPLFDGELPTVEDKYTLIGFI